MSIIDLSALGVANLSTPTEGHDVNESIDFIYEAEYNLGTIAEHDEVKALIEKGKVVCALYSVTSVHGWEDAYAGVFVHHDVFALAQLTGVARLAEDTDRKTDVALCGLFTTIKDLIVALYKKIKELIQKGIAWFKRVILKSEDTAKKGQKVCDNTHDKAVKEVEVKNKTINVTFKGSDPKESTFIVESMGTCCDKLTDIVNTFNVNDLAGLHAIDVMYTADRLENTAKSTWFAMGTKVHIQGGKWVSRIGKPIALTINISSMGPDPLLKDLETWTLTSDNVSPKIADLLALCDARVEHLSKMGDRLAKRGDIAQGDNDWNRIFVAMNSINDIITIVKSMLSCYDGNRKCLSEVHKLYSQTLNKQMK